MGREYIHSASIIYFFIFLFTLKMLICLYLKTFKFKTAKKEAYVEKPPQEIHKSLSREEQELEGQEVEEDGSRKERIQPQESQLQSNLDYQTDQPQSKVEDICFQGVWEQRVENYERVFFQVLPDIIVLVLNIMSFGSYIFLVFTLFVWMLIILLVNEMKIFNKYDREDL